MVFVQHTLTRRYLRSLAEWSDDLNEAWMFKDATEALTFCRFCGLRDVEIVVAGRESVLQIPVLIRRRADSIQRCKVIPIVLPDTELKAN